MGRLTGNATNTNTNASNPLLNFLAGIQRLIPQQIPQERIRENLGYVSKEISKRAGTQRANVRDVTSAINRKLDQSPRTPFGLPELPSSFATRKSFQALNTLFGTGAVEAALGGIELATDKNKLAEQFTRKGNLGKLEGAGLLASLVPFVGGGTKAIGKTQPAIKSAKPLFNMVVNGKVINNVSQELKNSWELWARGQNIPFKAKQIAQASEEVAKTGSTFIKDAVGRFAGRTKEVFKDESGFIKPPTFGLGKKTVPKLQSNLRGELDNLAQADEAGKAIIPSQPSKLSKLKSRLLLRNNPVANYTLKVGRAALGNTPTGRKLWQATDQIETQASIDSGLVNKALQRFSKLKYTPDELQNIRDVRDGKAQPISQKVSEAVDFLNRGYKYWFQQAQKAGIKAREIPNYEPQLPKTPGGFNTNKARENIIDYLIKSEQASGRAEAEILLDQGGLSKFGVKRFGPLDRERHVIVPDELKITNPFDQFSVYSRGAARRIRAAEVFGPEGGKAQDIIGKIRGEGGDPGFAKKYIDIFQDNEPREGIAQAAEDLSRKISLFESITKLGTAGIRNIAQGPLGSSLRNGTWNTVKAYRDVFTKSGREFADQAGSVTKDTIETALKQNLGAGRGFDIGAPFLRTTERWNRTVNTLAGKWDALANFNRILRNPGDKKAMDRLAKLGINQVDGGVPEAIKKGYLTDRQLLTAGNLSSAEGQFGQLFSRKILASQGSLGKLIYQFKSFPIEQTDLIGTRLKDEVLKKGNLEPLILLATAYPALGEATNDIISFLRGRKRNDNVAGRMIENLAFSGSLGILYDTIKATQFGEGGVASFLLGPTAGDVFKTGGNIGELTKGNVKPIAKQAIGSIPIIGQTIKNVAFPNENTLVSPEKSTEIPSRRRTSSSVRGRGRLSRPSRGR